MEKIIDNTDNFKTALFQSLYVDFQNTQIYDDKLVKQIRSVGNGSAGRKEVLYTYAVTVNEAKNSNDPIFFVTYNERKELINSYFDFNRISFEQSNMLHKHFTADYVTDDGISLLCEFFRDQRSDLFESYNPLGYLIFASDLEEIIER